MFFISADIQRTIEEALLEDDRILGITDFVIQQTGIDEMFVSFVAHTIEGDFFSRDREHCYYDLYLFR